MGLRYKQIAIEERCEMARLRAAGSSVRQIAAGLDRAPSTVARELKRNGSRTSGYRPVYAEQQARARRWSAGESRCTYRQRHDGDPVSVATAGRQAVTFDNGTEFAATMNSMHSASRPSSAIPIYPGRKAELRTPWAECAAPCPARPILPS